MKTLILACSLFSLSAFSNSVINVPAKDILAASRTLIAQTGPAYSAKGTIACSALNTGWGPATSTCTITINGAKAVVENANLIINEVAKVKKITGPSYNFSGKFEISSISSEFPPYGMRSTALITLK